MLIVLAILNYVIYLAKELKAWDVAKDVKVTDK